MGVLHHRIAHRLTGKQPFRQPNGSWDYPPLGEGNERGSIGIVVVVNYLETEHSHSIHFDGVDSIVM